MCFIFANAHLPYCLYVCSSYRMSRASVSLSLSLRAVLREPVSLRLDPLRMKQPSPDLGGSAFEIATCRRLLNTHGALHSLFLAASATVMASISFLALKLAMSVVVQNCSTLCLWRFIVVRVICSLLCGKYTSVNEISHFTDDSPLPNQFA